MGAAHRRGDPMSAATIELDVGSRLKGEPQAGTADAALDALVALFSAGQADVIQIALLIGLVGAILEVTGQDSISVLAAGRAGAGKSAVCALAASLWGTPRLGGGGLFHRAAGTENSFEALAEWAVGAVLALDEVGRMPNGAFQDLLYLLQGGSAKTRMDRHLNLRALRRFRVALLASAETGFAEMMAANNRHVAGGDRRRLAEIPFDQMPRPSEEAWEALHALTANHGWIGPAFVQVLFDQGYIEEPERLQDRIEAAIDDLLGEEA